MTLEEIEHRQEEALMAYNRVPQSEAAPWLQASMLAEIALRLAGINEQLELQRRHELLCAILYASMP